MILEIFMKLVVTVLLIRAFRLVTTSTKLQHPFTALRIINSIESLYRIKDNLRVNHCLFDGSHSLENY
jgi:hypothetical protein